MDYSISQNSTKKNKERKENFPFRVKMNLRKISTSSSVKFEHNIEKKF